MDLNRLETSGSSWGENMVEVYHENQRNPQNLFEKFSPQLIHTSLQRMMKPHKS